MRNSFCTVFIIATAMFSAFRGEAGDARWNFIPETAATVGQEKISKQQVISGIDLKSKDFSNAQQEQLEAAARLKLDQIIEKKIILRLMAQDNILPTADMVEREYKKVYEAFSPQAKREFLYKIKMDESQLPEYWRQTGKNPEEQFRVAFVKWLELKMGKVKISDDEVETFYRENQKMFERQETITLSRILIQTGPGKNTKAAREKAEMLLAQLKQGTDFAQLAAKNSDCKATLQNKGIFGTFSRQQLPEEFGNVVFTMSEGQFSEIIPNAEGFNIIKVISKSKPGYIPFDEVADIIRLRLKKFQAQKNIHTEIGRQKANIGIKVFF